MWNNVYENFAARGPFARWSAPIATGGFKVLASFQTIPNGRVPRAGRHAEIKPIMPVNLCTLWWHNHSTRIPCHVVWPLVSIPAVRAPFLSKGPSVSYVPFALPPFCFGFDAKINRPIKLKPRKIINCEPCSKNENERRQDREGENIMLQKLPPNISISLCWDFLEINTKRV